MQRASSDPLTEIDNSLHANTPVNPAVLTDKSRAQTEVRTCGLYPEIPTKDDTDNGDEVTPSAPPLTLFGTAKPYNYEHSNNWVGHLMPPPPPYESVTNLENEAGEFKISNEHAGNRDILGSKNDLEWHQVFDAFNEKRMFMALQWTPPPASGRPLENCLGVIGQFLNASSHPVGAQIIFKFLKAFTALTNHIYAEASVRSRRINVSDKLWSVSTDDATTASGDFISRCELFLKSFRLLMNEYMPKEAITDRKVPFGYDWFIFSGRMTYAVINAHITLCSVVDSSPTVRPYYTDNKNVSTRAVVDGLKNICKNFTESLGYERYSSNRVYIGTAFLYACLLEEACEHLTTPTDNVYVGDGGGGGGLMPDYAETLDRILKDPANRYDAFETLINEIGKSEIPPQQAADKESRYPETNKNVPPGNGRGIVTYDGIYNERSFFAHRRLRMYAYIHSYCEQLPSVQLLLRKNQLNDEKISVLLRAVEPMSDGESLYYFNLHSRAGAFKYRNGSALFAALGLSKYRSGETITTAGRVYVADKARILFVQSNTFTFHSIGQLSDLAYGEIETSNRDLMPAWLMGQRPLFRSEKNKLVDVPCASHLEPCVLDTGKSEGLELDLIKRRNTTDYTPSKASSALVAFEEAGIGAVYTFVSESNMDVRYSRCTVATPYYTFTTYFRITRCNDDGGDMKSIRLSCYTGCSEPHSSGDEPSIIGQGEDGKRIDFKCCSVHLFIQTAEGGKYDGPSVTLETKIGIERRQKSKCKYESDELQNLSLLLEPYGHQTLNDNSLGSVTILYRPKTVKQHQLPKSYTSRQISPRVTVDKEFGAHRIQVDSRYILYCDTVGNLLVILDSIEKRACVSPIHSKLQDDINEMNTAELLERASKITKRDIAKEMSYDSEYCSRIYAYF